MSDEPAGDSEIIDHYDAFDEKSRPDSALGSIEQERHHQIMRRHLPPPPAHILDVGGGPGAYSH